MNMQQPFSPVRTAIEISVKLLLLFVLVAWCLQILYPSVDIVAWGVIIAVSSYVHSLSSRDGLAGNNPLAMSIQPSGRKSRPVPVPPNWFCERLSKNHQDDELSSRGSTSRITHAQVSL